MKKLILFLLLSITVQHCSAEALDYGNVAIFLNSYEDFQGLPNDEDAIPIFAQLAAFNIVRNPEHYAFILSAQVLKNIITLAKVEYKETGKKYLLDSLKGYKIFVSNDKSFFVLILPAYEETMFRFIDEKMIQAIALSSLMQNFEVIDTKIYDAQKLISLWRKDSSFKYIFIWSWKAYRNP